MKNSYFDLIEQSYSFPINGFKLKNNHLMFNGISLKSLIDKYGTPFRLTYLPRIGEQIDRARKLFEKAISKYNYKSKYHYAYCTKCNHIFHVVKKALDHDVNLETSSSFDIDLIINLFEKGKINPERAILHNGFKTDDYIQKILDLQDNGFENSIIILDSKQELERILKFSGDRTIKIGLRMAVDEETKSAYNTSRLGIPDTELLGFFNNKIQNNNHIELKMLHFFVDTGIKNSIHYWGEFHKALQLYIDLRKRCDTLESFNLGGGFPISNQLAFEYDYELIIDKIIKKIKETCKKESISEPHIYTEFGKYTVGESGAIIFQVLEQKQQNDTELWYIVDNSLLNTIPDAWAIHEKFILLPINKWNNNYHRVSIGGISCDYSDYYNSEDMNQDILLPTFRATDDEPLYLGFFHTAAYQEAVSGYGGMKHCLIPSPRHVIIDKDEEGNMIDFIYSGEQTVQEMIKILGYN